MYNISNEVARHYLDQFCGCDFHISRTQAESAAVAWSVNHYGPIGLVNPMLTQCIVPSTVVVWFITINGEYTVAPTISELRRRLGYRHIYLPDSHLMSVNVEVWSVNFAKLAHSTALASIN